MASKVSRNWKFDDTYDGAQLFLDQPLQGGFRGAPEGAVTEDFIQITVYSFKGVPELGI